MKTISWRDFNGWEKGQFKGCEIRSFGTHGVVEVLGIDKEVLAVIHTAPGDSVTVIDQPANI